MRKHVPTVMAALVALFILTLTAIAQNSPIDKGSKILDGGLSYTSVSTVHGRSNTLTLNPAVGFFVSKGVVIGGQFIYQNFSHDNLDYSLWGLGPEFRYYFDTNR